MKLLSLMKALSFPKAGKHRTKQQCHDERLIWACMKVMLQRNKSFRRTFSTIPKKGNQGSSHFSQGHCQAGSCSAVKTHVGSQVHRAGFLSLGMPTHTSSTPCVSSLSLRNFRILAFCAWDQGHRPLATQLWTQSSETLHQKPCSLLQPVSPPPNLMQDTRPLPCNPASHPSCNHTPRRRLRGIYPSPEIGHPNTINTLRAMFGSTDSYNSAEQSHGFNWTFLVSLISKLMKNIWNSLLILIVFARQSGEPHPWKPHEAALHVFYVVWWLQLPTLLISDHLQNSFNKPGSSGRKRCCLLLDQRLNILLEQGIFLFLDPLMTQGEKTDNSSCPRLLL